MTINFFICIWIIFGCLLKRSRIQYLFYFISKTQYTSIYDNFSLRILLTYYPYHPLSFDASNIISIRCDSAALRTNLLQIIYQWH